MNTSSIQWIPFMVLYFIRTLREPGLRNPALCAVFFMLNALACWYYMVFSLFLLPVLWVFALWKSPSWFGPGHVKRTVLAAVFCLVPLAIFMAPILLNYDPGGYMVQNDASLWYSAGPFAYLVPSPWAHLLPRSWRVLAHRCGFLGEQIVAPGFTVILLLVFLFVRNWRRDYGVWVWPAVVFAILSFGPYLTICGHWYVTWTDWAPLEAVSNFLRNLTGGVGGFDFRRYALPLPGMLLSHIPLLNILRVPGRWGLLAMLCIAVLAGMGIKRLTDLLSRALPDKPAVPVLAIVAIGALCLAEQWPYPSPTQDPTIPAIYSEVAADTSDFAIFEIPSEHWETQARYIHFQTYHDKKIARGIVGRESPRLYRFLESDTLALILRGKLAFPDTLGSEIVERFRSTGYKYIVVHWDWLRARQKEPASEELKSFLDREFGPATERDGSSLYQVRPHPHELPTD